MENREEQYRVLLKQVEALVEKESDLIANLSNVSAAIRETFPFLWCGFYIVRGDILLLGPFQGHVACCRIGYGKGVCGTAWQERRSLVVDNVEDFPGYIACSSLAKSEIVVPVFAGCDVVAVLDIDSENEADFGEVDRVNLEKLAAIVSTFFD